MQQKEGPNIRAEIDTVMEHVVLLLLPTYYKITVFE
jgi:hypothetical protein